MKNRSNASRSFATTVRLQADPCYAARTRVLQIPDMLPTSRYRLSDEVRLFYRVLQAALKEDVLLLYGSRGRFKPELLVTLFAGFWPKRYRPKIVLYGDMFQQTPGIRGKLEQLIMKLADRAIYRYVVLTMAEKETLSRVWQIAETKVRVCPFFIQEARHRTIGTAQPLGQHIFAGGNSFRDFEPLLDAARQLPEYEFIFCTSKLSDRKDLPPNVKTGLVSPEQYVKLIGTATTVVIPLQKGLHRLAGLQTCFDAMWLKKPTIVTDSLGMREYIKNGETGLIVDGSSQEYLKALRWILDPAHRTDVLNMCNQAHQALQQFTLENHVKHLLQVMDEVL